MTTLITAAEETTKCGSVEYCDVHCMIHTLRTNVTFLPFCLLKASLSGKLWKNASVPLPEGFFPEGPGSQWTHGKWRACLYILSKPPCKLHEPVLRDPLPCKVVECHR